MTEPGATGDLIGRLTAIQREHGWTDEQFGKELGVSPGMISLVRTWRSTPDRRGRAPGRKFLAGVLRRFPELEPEVTRFLGGFVPTVDAVLHTGTAPAPTPAPGS